MMLKPEHDFQIEPSAKHLLVQGNSNQTALPLRLLNFVKPIGKSSHEGMVKGVGLLIEQQKVDVFLPLQDDLILEIFLRYFYIFSNFFKHANDVKLKIVNWIQNVQTVSECVNRFMTVSLILAYFLLALGLIQMGSAFRVFKQAGNQLVVTNFIVQYPQSKIPQSNLTFRGDNCNLTWSKGVSLKKIGGDSWGTSLLCPVGVKISCKVLVNDANWMFGANHVFTLTGTQTTDIKIYPSFSPKLNPILDSSPISSKFLKYSRKLSIYYPPSYYDNPYKQYDLLLMHDGQNLFDASKSAFGAWYCQNATTALIQTGKIREIIIVGIWNTPDRNSEYTYSFDPQQKFGGLGDKYLDFIEKQLLLQLRSKTLQGRIDEEKGISIGGSSLGGLISCYAAYTRPGVFRKSICMSSSFWWNNQDFRSQVMPVHQYSPATSIYIDSGDSGPSQDGKNETVSVYTSLKSKGYKDKTNIFYYLDKGGQHNEASWGKRFSIPLSDLFVD